MSAGWEIGDLALCVDDSPCACPRCGHAPVSARAGKIYRVADAYLSPRGFIALTLDGVNHADHYHNRGINSARFRKILPDEPIACETEFVTLLNRIKQPVEAERSALFMGGK